MATTKELLQHEMLFKREALRKAEVRYIEVTPERGIEDMAREISRIAQAERLRASTNCGMPV